MLLFGVVCLVPIIEDTASLSWRVPRCTELNAAESKRHLNLQRQISGAGGVVCCVLVVWCVWLCGVCLVVWCVVAVFLFTVIFFGEGFEKIKMFFGDLDNFQNVDVLLYTNNNYYINSLNCNCNHTLI